MFYRAAVSLSVQEFGSGFRSPMDAASVVTIAITIAAPVGSTVPYMIGSVKFNQHLCKISY